MNIGEKIRLLRIQKGLTQEELANRCELSKGFISQVERDLTSPSIATLVDILECLGTNLKQFFNEATQEKIVFSEDDVFVKQYDDLNYTIQWIVPNSQKNRMEPIIIDLDPGGQTEVDVPHEGEEFGYILSGTVFIHLGNGKFKGNKGDSFYFRPNVSHYIANGGKIKARVLWVSTPPNF